MKNIRSIAIAALLLISGCAPIPARDDPWGGPDKMRHAGASAVIAAAAAQYDKNRGASECEAFRFGVAISAGVGVAKEFADDTVRHVGWSWRDLVADGIGALLGSMVVAQCW